MVPEVLWGAVEAGALRVNGHVAYRFRLGVTNALLAEILWRGAELPKHWGLYVLLDHDSDIPIKGNSGESVSRLESEILGGYILIEGFEFRISFELPPVRRIYRPAALSFQRVGFKNCWKMAAFAWPELGHQMVNVWSQRPPTNSPVQLRPTRGRRALKTQSFLAHSM